MENNIIENLQKEELITYQQLFSIFDKEDTGTIKIQQFPIFIRGLGHCPTEAELKKLKQNLDQSKKGYITFNDLISCVINRKKQQCIQEQLMEAFQGLNSDSSSISEGEKTFKMSATGAKKYLTQFGQKFTQSQVQQFLLFLETNNLKEQHQFNYKQLSKILAYSYMK